MRRAKFTCKTFLSAVLSTGTLYAFDHFVKKIGYIFTFVYFLKHYQYQPRITFLVPRPRFACIIIVFFGKSNIFFCFEEQLQRFLFCTCVSLYASLILILIGPSSEHGKASYD